MSERSDSECIHEGVECEGLSDCRACGCVTCREALDSDAEEYKASVERDYSELRRL